MTESEIEILRANCINIMSDAKGFLLVPVNKVAGGVELPGTILFGITPSEAAECVLQIMKDKPDIFLSALSRITI